MKRELITREEQFIIIGNLTLAIETELAQLKAFPHCAVPYRRRLRMFRKLRNKLRKAWGLV